MTLLSAKFANMAFVNSLWQPCKGKDPGPAIFSTASLNRSGRGRARTVTGLVDGLVDSGHVARTAHPGDRRSTLVTLTPAGTQFTGSLRRMRAELAGELFGDRPKDEVAALSGHLEHVIGRLHRMLGTDPGTAPPHRR